MTIPPLSSLGTPDVGRDPRLTQAVRQLQGVFVEQLFKAMRETVPDDGVIAGGSGEAMFTGLMDQHLADIVPEQWSTSLGESLLRQFVQATPVAVTPEAS